MKSFNLLFFSSAAILIASVLIPPALSSLLGLEEKAQLSLLQESLGKIKTEGFLVTANREVTRQVQISKDFQIFTQSIPGTESTLSIQATYVLEGGINQDDVGYSILQSSGDSSTPTLAITLPPPSLRPVRFNPESLQVKSSKGLIPLGPDLQSEVQPLLKQEAFSVRKAHCQELLEITLDQASEIQDNKARQFLESLKLQSPIQVIKPPLPESCGDNP